MVNISIAAENELNLAHNVTFNIIRNYYHCYYLKFSFAKVFMYMLKMNYICLNGPKVSLTIVFTCISQGLKLAQ